MNERTLELLEYEALRALLGRYVASPLGRQRLESMRPLTGRSVLEDIAAETGEATALWRDLEREGETAQLSFSGLPDVGAAAAKLRIEGASLEALEILSLTTLLTKAAELRQALTSGAPNSPRLTRHAARISDFRQLVRDLAGKILPDGSVADSASVALSRVRREMERQRRLIHDSLERFLKSHREDGVLQEEFITLRNERFVVPIVPGAKKRIGGVVHGSSGSGQTLFVEPLETIELNNDLVRLTEEELREVHRILVDLTKRLREASQEIQEAIHALGLLDYIFAKARFAVEFECTVPRFTSRLLLNQARHPLLQDVLRRQRKRVVPITLELTSEQNTLLISGPNTGGKTVSMKTAGLLALMAQSGLPVPAIEAEFPIFDEILADIGDDQSIERSLSSFSAHVARIKEMVEAVTPSSLVLLDELGRATDPEEGGALGVAALEEFRGFGAFTLASTHLLALKVYGSNTPGVLNASMGFNEESLEPTYQLRIGAPGKSAGLDIASRLGLPAHLIDRARAAMSSSERDLANMLATLERQIAENNAALLELSRKEQALKDREERLSRETEKQRAAKLKEIEERAEAALNEFEKRAQQVISQALAAPEQRKQAEKVFRQVATVKRELRESITSPTVTQAAPKLEVREGARVRLRDISGPAKIRKVLANDLLEVEVGLLKLQVPRTDVLEVLPDAPGGSRLPSGVSVQAGPRYETLTREINLIGKTSDEARDELEKFLDTAMLADVTHIRIIHGHGMGVLKKMVQQVLSRHPAVEKFNPEGGATEVELKGG